MNQVILTGNISTDIEIRATQTGKMVAKFNLAVNTGWGEKKKTSFVPITVWDKTAEAVDKFSGKGKKVMVRGHLEIQQVEKDGQKRSYTSVIAEEVEFLSPRESAPTEMPDADTCPF